MTIVLNVFKSRCESCRCADNKTCLPTFEIEDILRFRSEISETIKMKEIHFLLHLSATRYLVALVILAAVTVLNCVACAQ